jgi:predicted ester cyclase
MEKVRTSTAEEENVKLVRQAFEISNTGDTSRVHEIISPNYFNHESQVDPIRSKLRGPEEFIDTVRALRSAFTDLHYEEQEIFATREKVAVVVEVTGNHTGNFFVIPPTGNQISYQAVHMFTIGKDSKIVEHKAIRDDLSLMVQLGVAGPTKQYEPLFQAWKGLKGIGEQ